MPENSARRPQCADDPEHRGDERDQQRRQPEIGPSRQPSEPGVDRLELGFNDGEVGPGLTDLAQRERVCTWYTLVMTEDG
jgi:hypothetical protein